VNVVFFDIVVHHFFKLKYLYEYEVWIARVDAMLSLTESSTFVHTIL